MDYFRLAFGTIVVLLPGRFIARALGQRTTSATLAWGMSAIFVAWAAVFTLHLDIDDGLGILGAIGVGALVVSARHPISRPDIGHGAALGIGIALGAALWRIAGPVTGDGLFHLARVRKLVDLGDLHLRTVDEFKNGGLHPGYAFPLWHGFLAFVAKVSGLDPTIVVRHESALLVPLACAVTWETGAVLFGSAFAGFSTLAASLALYCFAAGHGGSFASLALPATSSRQLLVPAAYALFFSFVASGRRGDLAAVAAIFGALVLVHPTYALFALLPLGAYAVVRLPEWRRSAAALVAALVPTIATVLWLRPIVNETITVGSTSQNELSHYGGEVVVVSTDHYRLAAEVVGRTGAVAIAALVLVPLAGFAARRRWGALVLGGTVAVLALELVPVLFVHFSDAVSLSQSRRAAGFVPFAFAFAGGLALLARSIVVIPIAFVAGIALQHEWPGDFAYGLSHGGPGAATWFALGGGAVALVAGLFFARRAPSERHGRAAIASLLFIAPVVWHGFSEWTPLVPVDKHALSPALAAQVRKLPPRSVVIADIQTSYEILAIAPVYVVAAPPSHVADTTTNDPYGREKAVDRWLKTDDPAIPRDYGATWAVRGGRLYRLTS